jgi:Uri superfamily endonuclease
MKLDDLPTLPGLYLLGLTLEEPAFLQVGRLGAFDLPAGCYLYVGSAHGPGGLRGRLAHHLRPVAAPHWHIDALRSIARLNAIWWATAPAPCEHDVARALAGLPGVGIPMPRFGASDCRCAAHLVWLARRPELPMHLPCGEWTFHSVPG